MKKVPFGELAFVLGVVFTCMGVALMVSSDLGLSMVAAPAYILGEKFAFLTTGMAEWGIQGTLFILGCVLMRRFSFPLLLSLAVAALNAAVLDVMLTIFAGVSAESFMGQLGLYLLGLGHTLKDERQTVVTGMVLAGAVYVDMLRRRGKAN